MLVQRSSTRRWYGSSVNAPPLQTLIIVNTRPRSDYQYVGKFAVSTETSAPVKLAMVIANDSTAGIGNVDVYDDLWVSIFLSQALPKVDIALPGFRGGRLGRRLCRLIHSWIVRTRWLNGVIAVDEVRGGGLESWGWCPTTVAISRCTRN